MKKNNIDIHSNPSQSSFPVGLGDVPCKQAILKDYILSSLLLTEICIHGKATINYLKLNEMKNFFAFITICFIMLSQAISQTSSNNYLGLAPPGNTPVLFAPGIISTVGYNEHTLSVSSDGNEIYFTRDPMRRTFVVKRQGNTWSAPLQAAFTGREAIFSPDGSRLFYNDGDIGYMEKKGNDWSSPIKLGTAINTAAHEYYASVSNDGTLYFSRIDTDCAHIYESKLENGQYLKAKRLPSPINLDSCNNYHSFISPRGDYIIFNSNRAGGFGGADLYICFKKASGGWGDAVNLGNEINSDSFDLCPVVSPDGKYFFFTKYNSSNKEGDIYWVSAGIIDSLRNIIKKKEEKSNKLE